MRLHRFPFVVALIVFLVVAVAIGTDEGSSAPSEGTSNDALSGAQSSVWFCPGLPSPYQGNTGRVTFANIGSEAADVVVTNRPDEGDRTTQRFSVPANTVVTKVRDALGAPGALTVETFGPRVIVEEGVHAEEAVESEACATATSMHWYFPVGTTPRGVQQILNIDNPYAADAKVNVTLRTPAGMRRLERLQGIDIARRSRLQVPIEMAAVREAQVSVQVDAVVGSVVSSQTLVFASEAGTPGIAYTLGAPATAADWTFAGGVASPDAVSILGLLAPGTADVPVVIQAITGDEQLPPIALTVQPDQPLWVTLGGCEPAEGSNCLEVPEDEKYSLVVRSEEQGDSVVAQVLTRYSDPPNDEGAVTVLGVPKPAKAWAFAVSSVVGERATFLEFFNPNAAEALVEIQLIHEGKVDEPAKFQGLKVPPGGRLSVRVWGPQNLPRVSTALLVQSSGSVFVERSMVGRDEAVRSVGVAVG